ncbi:hypothetical protein WUE_00945 [Enterococcus faecalis EnGen0330]|uniref:hypothetical protein n=1 Tax=Enterococcus faecalis TaxID=1351 RepID=UPI00032E993D|nr:hypothetical protein [Enterococcus faecalis]EOK38041.1 hypothetical protein WUE_00945 [Enterococcus faecalis EnGen0330]NSR90481.1 hypothetical protein [Enterococcus faecalis]
MHELIKEIERQLEMDRIEEGNMSAEDVLYIVKEFKRPYLNENQQIVLDWLKESCKLNGLREVIEIMGFLSTTGGKMKYKQVAYAYGDLNDDELKHVLQAFSQWSIEQEEAK